MAVGSSSNLPRKSKRLSLPRAPAVPRAAPNPTSDKKAPTPTLNKKMTTKIVIKSSAAATKKTSAPVKPKPKQAPAGAVPPAQQILQAPPGIGAPTQENIQPPPASVGPSAEQVMLVQLPAAAGPSAQQIINPPTNIIKVDNFNLASNEACWVLYDQVCGSALGGKQQVDEYLGMVGQRKGAGGDEWIMNGTRYWKVSKVNTTAFARLLKGSQQTVSRFV